MVFPFTFSFSVPGVSNPFSTPEPAPAPASVPVAQSDSKSPLHPTRRPHPATLPPSRPLSRKRGWVPPSAEPTQPTMSSASSRGYLDTPAKYRDFTVTPDVRLEDEVEEMVADLPPAKRRRTLAGSIVSTAVSAALIGTAVGLTVYRLWRDRGKDPAMITAPPPPYERGNWEQEASPSVNVIPPTPRTKKSRSVPTVAHRTTQRHRRQRSHAAGASVRPSSREMSPAKSPVKPEFDFSAISPPPTDERDELDDTMDWMGGRLAQLIEEGKRALGKEVVVMSETAEDAEDDASGNWEEEDETLSSHSRPSSRRGSMRRKQRPQHLGLPASHAGSPGQFSPYGLSLSPSSHAMPISGHSRTGSEEANGASSSFTEDSSAWQSLELRESMQKARARYLQSRH
ncbi:hypothetical protein K488DRAFT_49450 [Vararia minispora EC-137]|uniref:Uncharacterized protein n=1 Tax=Vararia minispora EC-137 TaxID=1314806 RepID=A0ACB8QLH1_9AGAM|nr:hypothetical protein K488DRAFT_49450 [Vararia minispora EC-137]